MWPLCSSFVFLHSARSVRPTSHETRRRTTLLYTLQRTSHFTAPKLTIPLHTIPHFITPHYTLQNTHHSHTASHHYTSYHSIPHHTTPSHTTKHHFSTPHHTTPHLSTPQASTPHPTFSFPILSSRVQFTSTTFALFSSLPRRLSSLPFNAHTAPVFWGFCFPFMSWMQ